MNKPRIETQAPASGARRGFIGAALCTPALAVAAVVGRGKAVPAPPSAPPAEPQPVQGYHVTDHIRTYYTLARF